MILYGNRCLSWGGSLTSQPYFLYFRWEEREGEKITSGHSGQLPVPQRNVIIAAGHAHGMQIKTATCYCFVKLVPTLANCRDRELIISERSR